MPDSSTKLFLDYGVSTDITACAGLVTSARLDAESNPQQRKGIGAQGTVVGGATDVTGEASFLVQSSTLLEYALRSGTTNPTMTALAFAGGVQGSGQKHTACYIDTLSVSCAVEGSLTAALTWMGTGRAAYTTARQTPLTPSTYEWFSAAVTFEGAAWLCQSFTLNLGNGIYANRDLDTKASDKRLPVSLGIGDQTITLEATLLTQPDATQLTDIYADTIATDLAAVLAFTNDTDTLTFTLANLHRVSRPVVIELTDGAIEYSATWAAADNDASALTIAAA